MSRPEALQLYRRLIRYARQVSLSDPGYFVARVRADFRRNKRLTQPAAIEFQLGRARSFLELARLK